MSDNDQMPPDGDEGLEEIYRRARTLYRLLQQGERWLPDGKPAVAIKHMDPAWRHNTAAFLVRRAHNYLLQYDFGEIISIWGASAVDVRGERVSLAPTSGSMADDAVERDMHQQQADRAADPEAWIKSTRLYRALVKGLPEGPEREALAEVARHWSDCPVRTDKSSDCVCASRRAELSARKAGA